MIVSHASLRMLNFLASVMREFYKENWKYIGKIEFLAEKRIFKKNKWVDVLFY